MTSKQLITRLAGARICGLFFCYNEDHILAESLRHYLGLGIDLVMFDNFSTDGSLQIARGFQERRDLPGRLLEIVSVKTDGYEWGKILRAASNYMHDRLAHYRWIMLIDADSFYFSPVRGAPLASFILACDCLGYNIIGGNLYEFYPTERDDSAVSATLARMHYHREMPWEEKMAQEKIFRYHPGVDFYSEFGHRILRPAPRLSPVRFIYNHYPWVTYEHGLKKIFQDRKPRYVERRQNPVNHMHYLDLLPEKSDLVRNAAELSLFDLEAEQMSRVDLIRSLAADRTAPALKRAAAGAGRAAAASARFGRIFREDPQAAVTRAAARAGAGIRKQMAYRARRPAAGEAGEPELPDKAEFSAGFSGPEAGSATAANSLPDRPEPPRSDIIARCEDINVQGARVTGFPETYHFLLTNFCNASCLFCNQKLVRKGRQQITLDRFRRMVAHIPVEAARIFYLSGGGDPLLCRDIIPIINYINTEFPWIEIRLRTNGLLLQRHAAELARTDIRLELSVHGATEDTNNRILKVRNSGVIFDGVSELNRQLEMAGRRMHKLFVPAMSKINIGELPALIQKAAGLDISEVEIYFCRFYVEPGRKGVSGADAAGGGLDPSQSLFYHQDLYNRTVTECCDLAAALGVTFRWEALFGDKPGASQCYDPWRNAVIDWEGDVFPCCGGEVWFFDKVKSGAYRFGNVLEEDLYQLLDNDTYIRIRRTLSPAYGDNLIPECGYCHNSMTFTGPDDIGGHIITRGRTARTPIR